MRKSELSSACEPSGNADKKLSKLVPIQRDGELRGHQVVLVVARKKYHHGNFLTRIIILLLNR
jgi:hypothetical protein